MFYTTALWHVHVIGLTMDDNEVKSVEVEQQVKCFQPGERSQEVFLFIAYPGSAALNSTDRFTS